MSADAHALPPVLRQSWSRLGVELKTFVRNPMSMVFTFLLPVLLLLLFGAIFSDDIDGPPGVKPLSFRQYFLAGMIASGILSTSFVNLAVGLAVQQHEGLLKRLSATPLSKTAFFAGKLGLAVVASAVQTVIMLGVGRLLFGLEMPAGGVHWAVFLGVFVLGVSSGSLLGIAYTRIIPNAEAAPAVVQPVYLTLQFISGVFFRFTEIPSWLQAVASIFPLRWMAQGFRYSFLPAWFESQEPGGSWDVPLVLAVLAAWLVAGFVLCLLVFRWDRGGTR